MTFASRNPVSRSKIPPPAEPEYIANLQPASPFFNNLESGIVWDVVAAVPLQAENQMDAKATEVAAQVAVTG